MVLCQKLLERSLDLDIKALGVPERIVGIKGDNFKARHICMLLRYVLRVTCCVSQITQHVTRNAETYCTLPTIVLYFTTRDVIYNPSVITIFGASGYTGQLVTRALAAMGLPLRLAGRS